MLRRLKLWWAVRSAVTAIALDPNKFYVMIYDPEWVSEDLAVQLHRMLSVNKINGVFVGIEHDNALRMVPVVKEDIERLLEKMR